MFNRCTLWCAFKWKATLLLCICRAKTGKKFHIFLNEKFLVREGFWSNHLFAWRGFRHQNSSLSHHLFWSRTILYPYPKVKPLLKKNSIQSAETVSETETVSRNSQQNGASTRLTLQSHKAKGNQATIQIFSEFDSLHEMGVKAVF